MDGPGTFSWITREFLYKIKDARAGSILKVRGGGELWSSFEAIIYNITNPKGGKFPKEFYGRKTVEGKPTAVVICYSLQVVDEPQAIGRVMADVGLHALEYEMANSPSEAVLARPATLFPFNIMDKKESAPRWVREDVSTAEALAGGITRPVAKGC